MKTQYIAISVAAVLIVLVLGGWYAFSNPQIASALGMRPMQSGAHNGMASSTMNHGGPMRAAPTTGTIETLNGAGFTLTLSDGTTKNVNLTASTTIQNFASASSTPTTITADQLSVGEQVSVIGMPNATDGSIDARAVLTGVLPQPGQYRGGMMGGMGGGRMGSSTYHGGPRSASGTMPNRPAQ